MPSGRPFHGTATSEISREYGTLFPFLKTHDPCVNALRDG